MPRFILTADWHLRDDRPRCRIDESWHSTQEKALEQMSNLCNAYRCDLVVVGDMFHRPTEYRMVGMVQRLASRLRYGLLMFLAGNHDMRYHSLSNMDASCITLLSKSNNCGFIQDCMEGSVSAPNFGGDVDSDAECIFIHTLCFPSKNDIPRNVKAVCADDLLDEYPKAKWIFVGDYHRSFHVERNGSHVVNSGCLLRQVSDMKNYECGVFLVDTDKDVVKFIRIIDDKELVDDSYMIEEKGRDDRLEDFVSKLGETKGVTLDFLDNVEKALETNTLDEKTKVIVRMLVG